MSDPSSIPPPPEPPAPGMLPDAPLPAGVTLTSPWMRLVARLLEVVLMTVTLLIGWVIWAAMLAPNGQTPAKKLLGMRVVSIREGRPAGFGTMLLMRGIVGEFVANLAIGLTLGVLAFMPFWDKRNQTIWEKVSGTLVVDDPNNAWNV